MAEFVRIKMDLIHDRNSNILLSLHDSRIKKITFRNNVLILHLNKIFQYTKDGEKIYSGEVLFYDNDIDGISIESAISPIYELEKLDELKYNEKVDEVIEEHIENE